MRYADEAACEHDAAGKEWFGMAWQKVASLDALPDGGVVGVDVDGTTVALFRMGDEVHATDGICTHALALLADGFVDDGTIECPLHQAVFDIRTGKALSGPAMEDLRVFPVKVDGAEVLIDLGA
jgi:nitrite reductase/ring-hydroxylating ferredoxin subunit